MWGRREKAFFQASRVDPKSPFFSLVLTNVLNHLLNNCGAESRTIPNAKKQTDGYRCKVEKKRSCPEKKPAKPPFCLHRALNRHPFVASIRCCHTCFWLTAQSCLLSRIPGCPVAAVSHGASRLSSSPTHALPAPAPSPSPTSPSEPSLSFSTASGPPHAPQSAPSAPSCAPLPYSAFPQQHRHLRSQHLP